MPVVRNTKTFNVSEKHEIPFVRIMRGTSWGNPFVMGVDGTRDEVVERFELYARWRMKIQPNWIDRLVGRDLLCCCAPEKCHGDVLLKLAKERQLEIIRRRKMTNGKCS